MLEFPNLVATADFLLSFANKKFGASDRRAFLRAFALLNRSETHPSLRIHQLHGDKAGLWSASASSSLRIEFDRMPDGRKVLRECTRHYDK